MDASEILTPEEAETIFGPLCDLADLLETAQSLADKACDGAEPIMEE